MLALRLMGDPLAPDRELATRHQFSLPPERVQVAINDQFVPMDTPLNNDDRVVFIPPVAGG